MKSLTTLCVLIAGLAIASTTAQASVTVDRSSAAGPLQKFYWTERKAERRVAQHFADVETVDCLGFGYNWRVRRGIEYYTAFYCSGELTDYSPYEITVYTTGRRSFRWYEY